MCECRATKTQRLYDNRRLLDLDVEIVSILAAMTAQSVEFFLMESVHNAALEQENCHLRNALKEKFKPSNIIGNPKPMREAYALIEKIARTKTTVLILGESGVGKELVASAIHYNGVNASGPFVKFNCAALTESVIESELFGHEKGSFTGAHAQRKGRFENVLVLSMFTPGDIEALKTWIEAFGLTPVVAPDIADSLDGHLTAEGFSALTCGGTTREQLATMDQAAATLVIGDSLHAAADALRTRTGVPDFRFPHLTSLHDCDDFTLTLSRLAGRPAPPAIERQRAQLLDAMVDSQFTLGAARVAVAADPDLLAMLCDTLVGQGAEVVAAISTAASPVLARLAADTVMVGDLEDLERQAHARQAHLIVTNSHGVDIAARLGCGLLRAGYPLNVDHGHDIVDLLNEVSFALAQGGLSWVDRACAKLRDENRFARMAEEDWDEEETTTIPGRLHLITSVD